MQSEPEQRPAHSPESQVTPSDTHAVAVTGACGRLGLRVLNAISEAFAADFAPDFAPDFARNFVEPTEAKPLLRFNRVLAIDHDGATAPSQLGASSVNSSVAVTLLAKDLRVDEIGDVLGSCAVLIHLASAFAADGSHDDVAIATRVFAAAAEAGISHLVIVSSAAVYGAWPDNPVPMTEARDPKPNPGFEFAASRLALEAAALSWKTAGHGRSVTILRPVITPSQSGTSGWLYRAVKPSRIDLFLATPPPVQYVHVDDVAAAVVHSAKKRLDGTFNVSPDRWLRGEDAPALMAMPVTVPATGPVREVASAFIRLVVRPLLSLAPRPAGSLALSRHPWVVANDKLRATGWQPLSTTEEVLVAQRRPSRLGKLFARKRQEVTMAAVGAAGVSAAGIAAAIVRRAARTRR